MLTVKQPDALIHLMLKKKAVRYFETSVSTDQSRRRNMLAILNFRYYRCEKLIISHKHEFCAPYYGMPFTVTELLKLVSCNIYAVQQDTQSDFNK